MKTQSWSYRFWNLGLVSSLAITGALTSSSEGFTLSQKNSCNGSGKAEISMVSANFVSNDLPENFIDGEVIRSANYYQKYGTSANTTVKVYPTLGLTKLKYQQQELQAACSVYCRPCGCYVACGDC
jgi:hypothetical protein